MSSLRVRLLAAAALLAVAVAAALRLSRGVDAASATDAAGEVRSSAGPTLPPAVDEVARELADVVAGELQLTVVEDGHPAVGAVSWVQMPDARGLIDGLAETVLLGSRDDPSAQHTGLVDGTARIELQAACWTWLRVGSGTGKLAFDRLAPFSGRRQHRIDLSRGPIVHVQVVRADWRTPVAGAQVRVLCSRLDEGSIREIGTWTCDASGYAQVEGLAAGRAVLVASGARPEEGPPHACPMVIQPGQGDLRALLVEPAPTQQVTLDVLVASPTLGRVRPKLFLRRLDAAPEPLHPQAGTLQPGLQKLAFAVPAGTYEIGVLPQGEFRVGGENWIEVPARDEPIGASVSLLPAEQRTTVRLRGVDLPDLPLRVSLASASGMRGNDPAIFFVGGFHWHSFEGEVPSQETPVVVVGIGRQRNFVSRPVRLVGPAVDVDLAPACRLEVHWVGDALTSAAPPVLAITSKGDARMGVAQAGSAVVCPMERKLVVGVGARRPAWVASAVVELGDVVVEGLVGDRSVWRREVTLATRQHLVRVGD
ncbi:MAG: hypothetical protein AB7O97_19195 [Planctomycetota bacterium]